VDNRSISVSPEAQPSFLMTVLHKDICAFMLENLEETNDQEIIKGLTVKANQLLSKLEQLKIEHDDGVYGMCD
jgi:hypothetical protein